MLAIIGGTGLNQLPDFELKEEKSLTVPYSDDPVVLSLGKLNGIDICFLPRHGRGHVLPPHRINYRANIRALKDIGVGGVIAVNAVGGLHPEMGPGVIAIPRQIIDYSHDRDHTYFDGEAFEGKAGQVTHVDFTEPYDGLLRMLLMQSADQAGVDVWPEGVYACTQGPRLETAAEVARLQKDGCDMVGMTGMPEAALARELELPYACLALSVNWGAGITNDVITMEAIEAVLAEGMGAIQRIVHTAVSLYGPDLQSR